MKQLTSGAPAFVVALLLMVSFTASAVVGQQKKRRPTTARTNYAQFSHRTHFEKQKLACDSCHKFPTDNWKNVREGDAAFPDVAEFPKHETCLSCHRQQFFARQRPAPAICSNCHVNVTPKDTARFLFPSLGDVTNCGERKKNSVAEFAVSFPHEKHEDQECVTCHQLDKEGEVKGKPNNHSVCFSCHNAESELPPAPSSCGTCHKLAEPSVSEVQIRTWTQSVPPRGSGWVRRRPQSNKAAHAPARYREVVLTVSKPEPEILEQSSIRHVNFQSNGVQMKVRDEADFSKFQHSSAYHQRLPCALCHRRESNTTTPAMPGGKDHLPCAGCHVKQFADSSNPICTNCHTNPPSKELKAFPRLSSFNMKFDHARHPGINCANCHRPARGGVALTIPVGSNAHATCFQCHGPQAKAGDRDISSCGVCHELGRYVRPNQMARAFKVGFSHARHSSDEGLSCKACHRVREGVQQNEMTAPQPLNHHARAGSFSCVSCHNGKRAFGDDDFSVCTRCHKGSAWHF
jgi:c(7)-type cytochrome triheme protein